MQALSMVGRCARMPPSRGRGDDDARAERDYNDAPL